MDILLVILFVVMPMAVILTYLCDISGVTTMICIGLTIIIHVCFWVIIGPSIVCQPIGALPFIYDGAIALMVLGIFTGDLHVF